MTMPARVHLPTSPAQKPANHLPSIRPGRSTPAPARPPPPSPSRVTMTVPARAHLSASPAPNPYKQLSFMSPGRSTPPPAPPRLPASATRPVATGASQSYSVTTSCMAKDPVEKLIYEFNDLRLFMIDPDRSVLSRLLNQLCDPRSLCSLPVEDTLLVFETASQVHGRNIVPHIGQIVSTIIRIMSSVTGSLNVDGCSRVIRALSIYGIDPLGTKEEKSGIISSLCSPLSGCLMSTKESVSSGSALCVTALIQSNNWKFASHELVNNICLKVSGALEEVHCQTTAHLGLVIALSKQKQLRFGHWQPLIKSGLSILDESTKARNSELIISSIEMIQSIMKTLDLSIMSYEISSIAEAMEPLQGVCEPEVRNAATQLAQIATELSNQISSSPCAVPNTRKRRRNDVEEITSAYHAFFVCSSDKSDWVSLHDYARDNRASLIDKLNTPRSPSSHVSETTCNDLKLITRKSYQLVENVHEAGLTLLGQFSSRNFVIDKYKNVKFTEATAEAVKMIAEEGVEMKEEDRHAFVYMMKREIFDNKPLPVDMSKWLSLVEGCDESISEILKYHINLMDEHQSASAFTSMFDTLLDMLENDRGSYEAVMTELKGKPRYCDWQKFVNKKKGNGYLNETFRYSIDEKGLIYVNSPMGLLLMLRNSRHHSAKFKEAEFARIVAEHFPDLLSDLQLALHRQKKLSKLNLSYSMG